VWLALAVVLVLRRQLVVAAVAPAGAPGRVRRAAAWGEKQYFAPLRLLLILALAYWRCGSWDRFPGGLAHPLAAPVVKVGQQACRCS
jgi:hypothetical protein